ncbi:hypothetical protein H7849_07145 [Alloacidobacterium dinghuense]|uniref:Uncharacterized protein n=1 Tax=Alloacidobacterium dinghuense TaxID=2763107 RepID=A0A7G8BMC4_9BACT|nr:hypothetical protein [Alloacidobacterium dinghuense]QNI33694.1 hypothetical protein H7849_07145 [Alloacidobacterium dinghuense]
MDDLLVSLIYVIAEALLEALLEIIGEAVIAWISRAVGNLFAPLLKSNRFITTLCFALLGVAAGISSIAVFPHRLVAPSKFHGISLLLSPLITGFVMSQVGRAVRSRGQEAAAIESFGYGFVFALAMAIIRFVFVK